MILEQESIDVFLGLDVGKTGHHAVALNRAGKKLYDKALPQDETKIRDVLTNLGGHGKVLVVVDQPATIGALPVAVAQAAGAAVGYLPGLAMRRIADLHPGQAKTDARDAAIIAEAARSMPHTLRSVELDDETLAELGVLCGFDDDLAGQITATSNRIRGLLTQIHPALERAVGPHLGHPAAADLLTRYPTPVALKTAGRGHVKARLKKHAPRAAERLTEAIFTALSEQTVVVVGTGAAAVVLPKLAEQLLALRRQRDEIASQVQALVEAHPLYEVLTSMPGIGVRTCARILTEVTGKHFASAAHLASYAGIAPVTRRSGTSIRGEHPSRRGNKKLKRALFLSAFAALHHPPSRAYYDRKRAEGKRHNQAIIALARRRSDVLFAMLRDGTLYEDPAPKNLPSAA
ncbi:IS110 family transposase [Arthrobacter jiangjiafuii]|uniref:IS110 family transposase n=1 Tax=Arthrobacter jiangjiafuii TaxID=2817475 RepID=A0A975R101_9MICC|nr:IS110 family transposase [Arthrobacter jiangjiafuii]MBP3042936.1 IS110 family transposase [Arthrobacter jiangjiafuii]QWC11465.1 IS110 family transposase [Arthrobacter jiangjiafuii]